MAYGIVIKLGMNNVNKKLQLSMVFPMVIWGQNITSNSRIVRLQKIAVRLMTFAEYNAPSKPLFKRMNILPLSDYVFMLNALTAFDNGSTNFKPGISIRSISNERGYNKLLEKTFC